MKSVTIESRNPDFTLTVKYKGSPKAEAKIDAILKEIAKIPAEKEITPNA